MSKMGRFIGSIRANKRAAVRPMRRSKAYFVVEKDLSDYEERDDRIFFTEIGRQAAINAINENKAMNIPVTFMEDGWVVRRMPQAKAPSSKKFKRKFAQEFILMLTILKNRVRIKSLLILEITG